MVAQYFGKANVGSVHNKKVGTGASANQWPQLVTDFHGHGGHPEPFAYLKRQKISEVLCFYNTWSKRTLKICGSF